MAKLRKPIAVEADSSDAQAQSEVVIEPSDIVGGVKLADAASKAVDSAAGNNNTIPEKENAAVGDGNDAYDALDDNSEYWNDDEPESSKAERIKKKGHKRRHVSRKVLIIAVCAAIIAGLLSLWIAYDNNQLEKTFYQVKSSKVTNNIRIVSIADLHLKEFGEDNERLVYEISKLSPDLIALVGDMMMEQQPDNYEVVLSLCKQLEEVAPVYFSLGNHEIDAMLFQGSNIYKDAKKQGIKILNNETEVIDVNGTPMDIIGLTQNPTEFEEYGRKFFDEAMEADDNFKLLLNHYPEQFLGVLDDYEIDLALAGHAHGGQVRLPWIGGLYAADQGILPELCDGYHEIGNSKLVITRGLGKSGWCPRINNTPEIAVIDLGWY